MPSQMTTSAANVRRRLEEHAVANMTHGEAFTHELLARARASLADTTDGPWEADLDRHGETRGIWPTGPGEQIVIGNYIANDGYDSRCWADGSDEDLKFIAEARTLVPELIAELEHWIRVVAEFRRRDASADRVIARLKAEKTRLNEYIGELDREIDHPLRPEAQAAGRPIRSASDPVQAFNAFIEKWVAPRWHAHLADNDANDAQYVRTAIRGAL